MTKREQVKRNIGLTFDFLRKVVDDPSILDKIPDGSILEFVDEDFPKKEKATIRRGKGKRVYIRVKSDFEVI